MADVVAIPCGTEVWLSGGKRDAVVTAILIRGLRVSYECAWWDGAERYCEYVEAHEVVDTSRKPAQVRVGFQGGGA